MSDWDYFFNRDLKYQYIRLLLKDLSSAEEYYLTTLSDGVDATVNSSLDWVIHNQTDLSLLNDWDDWRDYYIGSDLEMILITLLNKIMDKSIVPLENFYRSGGHLASRHMNTPYKFTDNDEKALGIHQDYVKTVVKSINGELINGVYNSIGEHVNNKTTSALNKDLIGLTVKPVTFYELDATTGEYIVHKGYFSPYNRCLFTAKTEYSRAVNTGLLQQYSNYGVTEYDWVTSGLPNVCKECLSIEGGSPYSLEEIVSIGLPHHPNCSCSIKGRFNKRLNSVNSRVVDLTPKNNLK